MALLSWVSLGSQIHLGLQLPGIRKTQETVVVCRLVTMLMNLA